MKIPFSINRNISTNLPEQVADGFRQAIRSGYYKPDDVLPPRDDIAKALGISVRIPREAIRILSDENLVCARRGVGCTVLARKDKLWKGRVLIVERAMCAGSYSAAMMITEVRRRLMRMGYLYTSIGVDMKHGGRLIDLALVEEALRQPTDFVFALYPTVNLVRLLRGRVPFLCVGWDCDVAEDVPIPWEPPYRRLIAQCRRCGVRSVLFAGYGFYDQKLALFRSAGFDVEDLCVWPTNRYGYLEATEHGAFKTFTRRFASGRPRPDLVYFDDDYIARGGLAALMALGVKVPGDVRVVSMSNRGFTPSFPVSLARIENDPVRRGAYVAERIVARIEGRPEPVSPDCVRYVQGDSFPSKGLSSASP